MADCAPASNRRCEETSPLTGQRCRAAAVVIVERFGTTLGVCATCAQIFQWKTTTRIRGATRETMRQPARQPAGNTKENK